MATAQSVETISIGIPATTAAAPTRAIERQIVRKLMRKLSTTEAEHHRADVHADVRSLAERIIAVLAATVCVFLLGTYLQELLWAALGVATVLTLGFAGSES